MPRSHPKVGEPRRVHARNEKGQPICGGRRSNGETCDRKGRWLNPRNGRCKRHGGSANSGAPIKHGRYSEVLAESRLGELLALSAADPNLADPRPVLELVDAACMRAAERVKALDCPDFRDTALEFFELARVLSAASVAAREAGDVASAQAKSLEARAALDSLGALLRRGTEEDSALRELRAAAKELRDTVKVVWDVRLAKQNSISLRTAAGFFALFLDIVRRRADPKVAQEIQDDVDREIAGRAPAVRLVGGRAAG